MRLTVAAWPGHAVQALLAELPAPLAELPTPAALLQLLSPEVKAPLSPPDELRAAVRDLLRPFGYRPTGRGKPSSEYLHNAAAEGRLGAINAVVDAANVASLHSGLPISVVDFDLLAPPIAVAVPPEGSAYVFNRSGQSIDVAGLPCLCDAAGPCANAVKDAQRTKTSDATRRVLAVVWGAMQPEPQHSSRTAAWLGELLESLGAEVEPLPIDE